MVFVPALVPAAFLVSWGCRFCPQQLIFVYNALSHWANKTRLHIEILNWLLKAFGFSPAHSFYECGIKPSFLGLFAQTEALSIIFCVFTFALF